MVKYNYLYFSFLLLMLLLLIFISPFIFSFLGDNYIGGLKVIWIIGLGFVFNGMYKMLVNYIFFLEKNKLIFYITLLTALSNILLNLYLIPKIGIIGSALSFMLSCLIELLLTWFLSNSLFPLPWLFFLKSNNNIEV
jgi:O-antigen/teichoic acid export membrane protein